MLTPYRLSALVDMLRDIEAVTIGHRKENRYALADVYQMMLATEGFFPNKPVSSTLVMPANLRLKVDDHCSSCVSTSAMANLVNQANKTLLEFNRSIKNILANEGLELDNIQPKEAKNVSELDTTIKKYLL